MSRLKTISIFLLIGAFLMSCASVQSISPMYLHTDSSKSITLFLYDGQVIRLLPGEYKVVDQESASYISGTGTVIKKGSQVEENFLGKVYFRDIKEMQISEPAPAWQTSPLIAVGALAAGVIIFILMFRVSNI
jgi:hypothetical protein